MRSVSAKGPSTFTGVSETVAPVNVILVATR